MATYYSSPNNQSYSREHIPTSYQDSNMMMYMASDSYADAAALAANSQHQSLEMPPPPPPPIGAVSDPSKTGGFGDPGIVQGLSLSLGTQIPSMSGFSSFMSPMGFGDQDSAKPDLSSSSSPHYGVVARAVPSSKYLRAAQQLLDEVVNVRKALSQHEGRDNKSKSHADGGGDDGSKSESTIGDSSAGNSQAPPPPSEISHAEKQELQNKLTKLLSMLDEVDRRYRQYYQQMQIVVSSFDAIAGVGSAKPYTALALQTISRHFRCLRDAITAQIRATRKGLGEDDSGGKGVGISRLRFVDQQLRQQRALHQLGMMQQHAWRPQRGLPESSVSVLRAWLFEHFLHPYPKDSDKIMLARQTGLTRSQVSNWFINARVRLWKPMVEEMYKEETGEADMDSSNSSSENAQRVAAATGKPTVTADEDRAAAAAADDSQHHQHQQRSSSPFAGSPKPVPPDVEMARGLDGPDYSGLMTMMKPRSSNNGSLYPDVAFHQDGNGGGAERFMTAYHHLGGRFGGNGGGGGGSGVSLTLGLQHCDGGGPGMSMPMQMPGGPHHGFVVAMRGHNGDGGDMYDDGGDEGPDFEQQRFSTGSSNSHLLHDFVV